MKKCSKCKLNKPLSEFRKAKKYKYGVTSYCIMCINARDRQTYKTEKDLLRRQLKIAKARLDHPIKQAKFKMCNTCKITKNAAEFAYSFRHKDGLDGRCYPCRNIWYAEYKAKNPQYHKLKQIEWRLRVKFNLTLADFESLKIKQNNACAICARTNVKLVVDHCHKTNKVRGLLCSPCNGIIGVWNDSILTCQIALEYLSAHY